MKLLPAILAGLHAIFAGLVFGLAIADPGHSGLLPIIVFFADLPCSFLMEWLRGILPQKFLVTDAIVYITIGSIWWYMLGSLFRTAYFRIRKPAVQPTSSR